MRTAGKTECLLYPVISMTLSAGNNNYPTYPATHTTRLVGTESCHTLPAPLMTPIAGEITPFIIYSRKEGTQKF